MFALLGAAYDTVKSDGGEIFFWIGGLGLIIGMVLSYLSFRHTRVAQHSAVVAAQKADLFEDIKTLIGTAINDVERKMATAERTLEERIATGQLSSALSQKQLEAANLKADTLMTEVIRRVDMMENRVERVLVGTMDIQKGIGQRRRRDDPVVVMLIDDDEVWSSLMREIMRPSGLVLVFHTATTVAEGTRTRADVILLDLTLLESDGIDTVRLTIEAAPHTPIVVLTNSVELGAESIQAGAAEFMSKDQATMEMVEQHVAIAMMRSAYKSAHKLPPNEGGH